MAESELDRTANAVVEDWGGIKTVYHGPGEFSDFPWSKLDPERFSRDWSMGCGGRGRGWYISYEGEKDVWHEWEVPAALSNAISMIKQIAEQSTERKVKLDIRSALGIDD